jgi:AmmeMemoRadiSam system protein A
MNFTEITEADRQCLLDLAEDTIAYGLEAGRYKPVAREDFTPYLYRRTATFVTLHLYGELRGCIGNLQASRPLVEDVAHNAYAAAFKDPRFEPLTWTEFMELQIEISLLSPMQAMQFDTEAGLLEQLRPGVDGLLLEAGDFRATFLPKVWEHLPAKERFLEELKNKAGLSDDFWSESVNCRRYTTYTFSSVEDKV